MHALTHPRSFLSVSNAVVLAWAAIVPWSLSEVWWVECALTATLLIGAAAGVVDAETGRIPDRLVMLAATPTLVVVLVHIARGAGAGAVAAAGAGLVAAAGPLLVIHVVAPSAMGFGDVKLAAALGAALGAVDPMAPLLALCIASAVTVVVATTRRRSVVPFGPGLVLGATLALVPYALSATAVLPAHEGLLPWP